MRISKLTSPGRSAEPGESELDWRMRHSPDTGPELLFTFGSEL
jgi:hypothetical protein